MSVGCTGSHSLAEPTYTCSCCCSALPVSRSSSVCSRGLVVKELIFPLLWAFVYKWIQIVGAQLQAFGRVPGTKRGSISMSEEIKSDWVNKWTFQARGWRQRNISELKKKSKTTPNFMNWSEWGSLKMSVLNPTYFSSILHTNISCWKWKLPPPVWYQEGFNKSWISKYVSLSVTWVQPGEIITCLFLDTGSPLQVGVHLWPEPNLPLVTECGDSKRTVLWGSHLRMVLRAVPWLGQPWTRDSSGWGLLGFSFLFQPVLTDLATFHKMENEFLGTYRPVIGSAQQCTPDPVLLFLVI